jgi:alkaline phosphatase
MIAGIVDPRDTLLLFTADHSFDLRIHGGNRQEPLLKGLDPAARRPLALPFVSVNGHHTAEEVLVDAKGASAERVRGYMANTELFRILMAAYGWKQ